MDPYLELNVSSSANRAEIKSAYQRLILIHHPDKNIASSSTAAATGSNSSEKFILIQRAWYILGNAENKLEYDNRALQESAIVIHAEHVNVSEFQVNKNKDDGLIEYSKQCRCGDFYEFGESDLKAGINTSQCNGCSLYVTIEFD